MTSSGTNEQVRCGAPDVAFVGRETAARSWATASTPWKPGRHYLFWLLPGEAGTRPWSKQRRVHAIGNERRLHQRRRMRRVRR